MITSRVVESSLYTPKFNFQEVESIYFGKNFQPTSLPHYT
jgi:hypothetical protein